MADFSAISNLKGPFIVSMRDFWSRIDSECVDRSIFDAQGDLHERIDIDLVDKIDGILEPILGEPDESSRWWQNLDCYGDGIRPVSIDFDVLDTRWLKEFQALLNGPHEPFCILLQIHDRFYGDDDTKIGGIAIFSNKVMISRGIASKLASAA